MGGKEEPNYHLLISDDDWGKEEPNYHLFSNSQFLDRQAQPHRSQSSNWLSTSQSEHFHIELLVRPLKPHELTIRDQSNKKKYNPFLNAYIAYRKFQPFQ